MMMQKTNNFFLIHNYNTVPLNLLEYCNSYLIMDVSDDENVVNELEKKQLNRVSLPNTGHNITSYFQYFADNYSNLPEVICLCKGNMIGRHMSEEYFNRVYGNTWFTFLYEEKQYRSKYAKFVDRSTPSQEEGIASLVSESQYIEKNSSWYVESPSHPHRYFDNLDDLLLFIYQDPVIPRYCLFSPGACYIVRREQILQHTPQFYLNLNKLMDYGMNPGAPVEAHMMERILPIIFESSYVENPWMNETLEYDQRLQERINIIAKHDAWNSKRFKRIRKLFGEKPSD